MLLVINRTEEGRHKAIAKPCAVRKKMRSMAFRERPQAMVVPVRRSIPRRYVLLPPTTSEMDPKASRVHPQERLLTAGGQRTAKKEGLAWGMQSRSSNRDLGILALRNRNLHLRKLLGRSMSRAIVGRLTVIRPESIELTKVMQATVAT